MHHRSPALALSVFLFSCGSPGSRSQESPPLATVRDSVGITIVENRLPGAEEVPEWTVDPEPILNIGLLDGDPDYQFIRVDAAIRLSDGSFVVTDGRAMNVRIFDSGGAFVRWLGSNGQGPGEFQRVAFLGVQPGDTLVFSDLGQGRVSRFTPSGEFLDAYRIQSDPVLYPIPGGIFRDGTFVAHTIPRGNPADEFENVFQRLPISYRAVDRGGQVVADFGSHPGKEVSVGRESRPGGVTFSSHRTIPFGKVPAAIVSWDWVFLGSTDTYEILVYNPAGQLTLIIRLDQAPRPVTQEAKAKLLGAALASYPAEQAPGIRDMYANIQYPDFMPAYESLITDGAGNLWVKEYSLPWEGDSEWSVFDPEGRFTARVSLLPGFRVTDIGEDYILGVYGDEMDVEYVRMFSLKRTPPGSP